MTPEDRKTYIRLAAYRKAEYQQRLAWCYTHPGQPFPDPPALTEKQEEQIAVVISVELGDPLEAASGGPGSPECLAACAALDAECVVYDQLCDDKAISAAAKAILAMWKTFYCSV